MSTEEVVPIGDVAEQREGEIVVREGSLAPERSRSGEGGEEG